MTVTNTLKRQPTELDYCDPTKFKFSINKLPNVEFFTTAANIPGVNLGEAVFPTPFKAIPTQGDDLTFENLEISFLIDEQLLNYRELHKWLVGIGFPKSREQFESFRKEFSDTFPSMDTNKGSVLNTGSPINQSAMYGDASLIVMSSKNNPIVEVKFSDIFPVALGQLQFDQQLADTTYLTATATFNYKLYEMFPIT